MQPQEGGSCVLPTEGCQVGRRQLWFLANVATESHPFTSKIASTNSGHRDVGWDTQKRGLGFMQVEPRTVGGTDTKSPALVSMVNHTVWSHCFHS